MKSKSTILYIAIGVLAVGLTITSLAMRFSQLPDEKNVVENWAWAPSPYEWHALNVLSDDFNPTFGKMDVPSLYSPVRIKSYLGDDPYYGVLEQMHSWMIADLSRNTTELWRNMTSAPPENGGTHLGFKEALAKGFGGGSEDCSIIKVERAFRLRNLEPGFYDQSIAYLEHCRADASVVLMAKVEHVVLTGKMDTVSAQDREELKKLQSKVSGRKTLAHLVAGLAERI